MDGGDLEADREEWRRAFNDLSTYRIPFGKYKDSLLVDLPEEYLMWFRERGFPQGRLGELMQLVMEIKITGAEEVLAPLRRRRPK
ncbi:MAG: DUF3820 family protein [Verrucomicrobiota bacterium JB023]|nr:DUF3820 family protein [Verrucomicrobiota bacterium JB023]